MSEICHNYITVVVVVVVTVVVDVVVTVVHVWTVGS